MLTTCSTTGFHLCFLPISCVTADSRKALRLVYPTQVARHNGAAQYGHTA